MSKSKKKGKKPLQVDILNNQDQIDYSYNEYGEEDAGKSVNEEYEALLAKIYDNPMRTEDERDTMRHDVNKVMILTLSPHIKNKSAILVMRMIMENINGAEAARYTRAKVHEVRGRIMAGAPKSLTEGKAAAVRALKIQLQAVSAGNPAPDAPNTESG